MADAMNEDVTASSDNVFADLGFLPKEAILMEMWTGVIEYRCRYHHSNPGDESMER